MAMSTNFYVSIIQNVVSSDEIFAASKCVGNYVRRVNFYMRSRFFSPLCRFSSTLYHNEISFYDD